MSFLERSESRLVKNMTQPGHCNNGPNVSTERQRNRPKACKSFKRSGNENLDSRQGRVSR